MITRPRAVVEVLSSAFLWGFAFVTSRWMLDGAGPMWALSLRFLIAAAVTAPWWLGRFRRDEFWLAMPAGLIIGFTLLLQLIGLKYTSVAKNCFITVLYVVWIPFFEGWWWKRYPSRWHWVWVMTALIGTALMTGLQTGDWNRGDALTLLCSLTAALHILCIEAVQPRLKSGFRFNLYQTVWALLIPLACALALESPPAWPMPWLAASAIVFNAWMVTLFAFWLQIRVQAVLSSSVVALLFLVESPLAAVFGYWFLAETLNVTQILGAALILVAAAGTIRSSLRGA